MKNILENVTSEILEVNGAIHLEYKRVRDAYVNEKIREMRIMHKLFIEQLPRINTRIIPIGGKYFQIKNGKIQSGETMGTERTIMTTWNRFSREEEYSSSCCVYTIENAVEITPELFLQTADETILSEIIPKYYNLENKVRDEVIKEYDVKEAHVAVASYDKYVKAYEASRTQPITSKRIGEIRDYEKMYSHVRTDFKKWEQPPLKFASMIDAKYEWEEDAYIDECLKNFRLYQSEIDEEWEVHKEKYHIKFIFPDGKIGLEVEGVLPFGTMGMGRLGLKVVT